jgi:hypothetical protein
VAVDDDDHDDDDDDHDDHDEGDEGEDDVYFLRVCVSVLNT